MKIGFDLHGVMDKLPFFKLIGELLVDSGNEVHIITGREWEKLHVEIRERGILLNRHYTNHFSITDYLIKQGENVRWDNPDNPWFDENAWNKAKATYCKENNIDVHFDDTDVYADYFTTPIFVRRK